MLFNVTAKNTITGKPVSMVVSSINEGLAIAFFKIHTGNVNHLINFSVTTI